MSFCGISLAIAHATNFANEGAHDPTATYYFVLEELFAKLNLSEASHLLDVGCGAGRALAYFASAGLPGKASGIDLDPSLVRICEKWSAGYDQISVMEGDATTIPLSDYTHFYLFNPFDSYVLERFVEAIEKQAYQPITFCHMSDNGEESLFLQRPGWSTLEEGVFLKHKGISAYDHPQHYTIRTFDPNQAKGPIPFKGYLETERLFLRPWLQSDAADLFKLAKDPQVGPPAGWSPHKSIDESRKIIETAFSAPETYAICLRKDGRAIGCVALISSNESSFEIAENEAELDYWLSTPFWGHGIMTEAANALMERAFSDLGLKRIWTSYCDGDERSKQAMEKCGMKYVRTEHNVASEPIGARRTIHVMATPKR